jgi:F-type H+-transporting ATPase subunit a
VAENHSPLAQFEVKTLKAMDLAGYDVSFTNASLWMTLSIVGVIIFLAGGVRGRALVPTRWQSMVEVSYLFIANQVRDMVGTEGKQYFPLIFSVFMFVLFGNLLGMIPYSFTFTSHIIVTFALAMFIFLLFTLIALYRHGLHFFSYFLPEGTPILIAPLMIVIEIFSYLARPVSLSIRLSANMMAGHTMLKIIAGFVVTLGLALGWAPLAFLIALIGFEFMIAFLQAYIFTVLACVYLHDAIHLH